MPHCYEDCKNVNLLITVPYSFFNGFNNAPVFKYKKYFKILATFLRRNGS